MYKYHYTDEEIVRHFCFIELISMWHHLSLTNEVTPLTIFGARISHLEDKSIYLSSSHSPQSLPRNLLCFIALSRGLNEWKREIESYPIVQSIQRQSVTDEKALMTDHVVPSLWSVHRVHSQANKLWMIPLNDPLPLSLSPISLH